MARSRGWRRVVRFLAGLVGMATVLVGLPVLLWVLGGGNPLPSRWPTPEQIEGFIETGEVADATIVKFIAALAWLAWAGLVVSLVLDAFDAIRGRPRRERRGPFQGLATVLVASLGIGVSGVTGSGGARGGPAGPPAPPVETELALVHTALVLNARDDAAEAEGPPPEGDSAAPEEASRAGGPLPEHVVQRRDSLWSIAEARLGDGLRWREIYDLNHGRVQPDGGHLERPDQAIQPGWRLWLPADAATGPSVGGDDDVVVVEPGDTLWEIAEGHLGDPTRYDEVFDLNAGRPQPDGGALEDADLIRPGWRLALPPARSAQRAGDDPAPDAARPVPSTSEEMALRLMEEVAGAEEARTAADQEIRAAHEAVTEGVGESEPPLLTPATDDEDEDDATPFVGLLGAAGAGVAFGVGREVLRRRARRACDLPAHVPPPSPPSELDALRRDLTLSADADAALAVQSILRELVVHLGSRAGCTARPRLVEVAGERVEVLLSEAVADPPPPWSAEGGGLVWTRELGAAGLGLASGPGCTPLLVTLGRPEEAGRVSLDLEAEGVVTVEGDTEQCRAFVRSLLVEVTHPSVDPRAAVVAVGGFAHEQVGELEGVRVAESWAEVAADAHAWARQTAELFGTRGWPHGTGARAATEWDDGTVPLLVVVDGVPEAPSFDEFVALVAEGRSAAALVVLGSGVPGATRIEVRNGELSLPGLGLVCAAQGVSAAVVAQLRALLDDAELLPPTPVPQGQEGRGESGATHDDRDDERLPEFPSPYVDPPWAILVHLLGDIEVEGAARPLTAKETATFAYVALHGPVSAERIEEAVWPTLTTSRRKRLLDMASQCRSALGASHLPVAKDGCYAVGPDVRTDIELFEARVAHAAARPDPEAILVLRGALELVRGTPFGYPKPAKSAFVWVELENHISTWEWKVADAALALAELCLAEHDYEGAIWAAERGLLISATHTSLTEALMRAHWARGDRHAAESVYQSHATALEELGIDDVAESTAALWDELRGAPAAAAV